MMAGIGEVSVTRRSRGDVDLGGLHRLLDRLGPRIAVLVLVDVELLRPRPFTAGPVPARPATEMGANPSRFILTKFGRQPHTLEEH